MRLIALSDRVLGRDADYDVLFDSALEAIREHPGTYFRGVADTLWEFLVQRPLREDIAPRAQTAPEPPPTTFERDGVVLPNPQANVLVEGVPYGFVWCASDYIDSCTLADPALVWDDAGRSAAIARSSRRCASGTRSFRRGRGSMLRHRDREPHHPRFPRPPLWLAVGLVALLVRRPAEWRTIVVLWVGRVPRPARPRGLPGRRTRVRAAALSGLHRHRARRRSRASETRRVASIERVSRGPSLLDERSSDGVADGSTPRGQAASARGVEPLASRVSVIQPASRWPRLDVGELWHYRDLLWTLVWRDIVVRYKQTFLGIAWALLVPIFTATVYVIIFGKFANFPDGGTPYPSLVVAGVLPMQYFASAMTLSSMSLLSNLQLVTKVYFPRTLLPLAAVIVPLVDFVIGLPGAARRSCGTTTRGRAGSRCCSRRSSSALAVLTALGSGLLLSAVNVRFRDVRYMIPVFLQVLPLLSGVMFAVSEIPTKWQWILAFNPMTAVISGWRWAVLDAPEPVWGQVALGVGVAAVLFVGGLAVFRSAEPRFADTI